MSTVVIEEPLKMIGNTLVSALFRKFGSCFRLFDVAGYTCKQYVHIVSKIKFICTLFFYLFFLKVIHITVIFSDNVCIITYFVYTLVNRFYWIRLVYLLHCPLFTSVLLGDLVLNYILSIFHHIFWSNGRSILCKFYQTQQSRLHMHASK